MNYVLHYIWIFFIVFFKYKISIGEILRLEGKLDEAEKSLNLALEINKKILDPFHSEIANNYNKFNI